MINHPTHIAFKVEELVRTHIGSNDTIPLDADLINDLAMDSLEMVELGIILEKQFGVKLSTAAIRRCITLEDIVELVSTTREKQAQETLERS